MGIQSAEAQRQIDKPTTVNAATYTTIESDRILHVTYTTTGTVAIEIPSTFATGEWHYIWIKDADGNAGTNNITISTEGSETIDGAATAVINSNYSAIGLYTDGTNYFVI